MELSIFLAKVIGLYIVIVTMAVFLRRKELDLIAESFLENKAIILLSGLVALILGLMVVVSHNIWRANWQGVITFLGWLTLAKGLIRLFFPDSLRKLSKVTSKNWYWAVLIVFFFVGLWLLLVGFSL